MVQVAEKINCGSN